MHFIGRFESIASGVSVEGLTSEHIEKFIRSIVTHEKDKEINPALIEKAIKDIRMPMRMADPEARILEFVTDFFSRLEGVGYGDFKDENQEKTIKLLQERLYPPQLKRAMANHLEYQTALKKKLKDYIKLLCREAITQDKVRLANKGSDPSNSSTANPKKNKRENRDSALQSAVKNREAIRRDNHRMSPYA